MASGVIVMKGIKSKKKLSPNAVLRQVKRELQKQAKEIKSCYESTTRTWKKKPKFIIKEFGGNKEFAITVSTDSDVYKYLDFGTKIRWAVMSNNWKSKTRPGNFGSSAGKGRVVIAGRRAMMKRNIRPRPGIKARGWTNKIQKRIRPGFRKRVQNSINSVGNKIYD